MIILALVDISDKPWFWICSNCDVENFAKQDCCSACSHPNYEIGKKTFIQIFLHTLILQLIQPGGGHRSA